MAERTIALRIAIRDAEQAARTLRSLGTEGEAALSKLATGTAPVNRALGGLSGLFDDVGARATASWGPFDGVAGRLVGLGPAGIAAVAGIGAVTAAIAVGVRETAQAEVSYARLEGVLRATGGASGLTAKQIGELADEMESTTLATAEGVQDAAAALATFRSVSGDTFTDALRLAQDMASVFGGDLRGAAVQLGKALEDPIQGINALRRSGVSFSDAQKDVIKDLVETGRVAEAQRLILDALADQVGGAGEAEGHTLTGSFHAATAALGNMLEAMAKASKSADILKTTLLGFKIAFDEKSNHATKARGLFF